MLAFCTGGGAAVVPAPRRFNGDVLYALARRPALIARAPNVHSSDRRLRSPAEHRADPADDASADVRGALHDAAGSLADACGDVAEETSAETRGRISGLSAGDAEGGLRCGRGRRSDRGRRSLRGGGCACGLLRT